MAFGLSALAGCGQPAAQPRLSFDELRSCAQESLAIETEQKRIQAAVAALRPRYEAVEAKDAVQPKPQGAAWEHAMKGLDEEITALMAANQDVLERTDRRNQSCGGRDISPEGRARLTPELRRVIPDDGDDAGGVALSYEESLACARRAVERDADVAQMTSDRAAHEAGKLGLAALNARVRARNTRAAAFDFECRLQPHAPEHLASLPPELQIPLARALGFRAPGDETGDTVQ